MRIFFRYNVSFLFVATYVVAICFAKNLGGLGPVPALDLRNDRENWIEESVSAFCRRLELRSTWDRTCDEEGRR